MLGTLALDSGECEGASADAAGSLLPLVAVMFAYALVTNTLNPVSTSLLPDFIGPERRSRANAAVKVATSLTIIVAALISLLVVDDHPQIAFAIPAALMMVSVAVLAAKVRDSESPAYQAALRIRQPVSTGDVVIVEGYDGPQPV